MLALLALHARRALEASVQRSDSRFVSAIPEACYSDGPHPNPNHNPKPNPNS